MVENFLKQERKNVPPFTSTKKDSKKETSSKFGWRKHKSNSHVGKTELTDCDTSSQATSLACTSDSSSVEDTPPMDALDILSSSPSRKSDQGFEIATHSDVKANRDEVKEVAERTPASDANDITALASNLAISRKKLSLQETVDWQEEERQFDSILNPSSSVLSGTSPAVSESPQLGTTESPTVKQRKRWLNRKSSNSESPLISISSKQLKLPSANRSPENNASSISLSASARSLVLSTGKSLEKEKAFDATNIHSASSMASIDRVEAQRQQIIKNRQLQDQLRDLQTAQRKEIDGLKKTLGVQASVGEEKVEANFSANFKDVENLSTFSMDQSNFLGMSTCSSLGDIDQIYGNGNSALNIASKGSSIQTYTTEESKDTPTTPKTPLRIRLKRRILRHRRNNETSPSISGKHGKDPKESSHELSELNLKSYANSLARNSPQKGSTQKHSDTQSEFLLSTNRHHQLHFNKSEPVPPAVPSLSFESGADINEILPVHPRKNILGRNDYEQQYYDWEDSDDEAYEHDSIGDESQTSWKRLSRQVRLGSRGELPCTDKRSNRVMIHVYDLIASETMVTLPWGCDFPLGQCFSVVNSGLHMIGTGAYHVGVEVNGIEYAFGANNIEGLSGVFTCIPRKSSGYEYRCTLDFGSRRTVRRSWISVPDPNFTGDFPPTPSKSHHFPPPQLNKTSSNHFSSVIPTVYREVETFVPGHELMQQMAREYLGCDYDLLRKNCCTFARDTCLRLGVKKEEIPSWFLSLAEAGVATENCVAEIESSVVSPLKRILSGVNEDESENDIVETEDSRNGGGFEVITKRKRGSQQNTELEIVRIVESFEHNTAQNMNGNSMHQRAIDDDSPFGNAIGIRHTLSWTY